MRSLVNVRLLSSNSCKGVNSDDQLVVVIVPAHNLLFNSKLMNF